MNRVYLHLLTLNEVWEQATNEILLGSAEIITETFNRPIKYAAESPKPIIENFKHFPKACWSSELQMLGDKK